MADLGELRSKLVQGAFKVMESRSFVRLLQDRRVLTVLVEGMGARSLLSSLGRRVGATAARTLGLATVEDLRSLENDIRCVSEDGEGLRAIDRSQKST